MQVCQLLFISSCSVPRTSLVSNYTYAEKKLLRVVQELIQLAQENVRLRMSLITEKEFVIKLGARGGVSSRDEEWDEVSFSNVRHILLTHGDAINSIQLAYVTVLGHRHGGDGDSFDCINLESWETLQVVKGYYGPARGNCSDVVRSLTVVTNRGTFGPFGREEGTPFCFNLRNGVSFWGFHGRCNSSYLCAIGVYVKPTANYKWHLSPKPSKFEPNLSFCNPSS